MNVVGRVSSFITQGMYSVATPFHPFGGAVDIIVVKQEDGTFRSTPWYVRFGKFQGVLKGAEKLVKIEVNGVEANFHMHLDNSGEAYFVREVDPDKNDDNFETVRDGNNDNTDDLKDNRLYGQDSDEFNSSEVEVRDERVTLGINRLERVESDCDRIFYEFQDDQSSLEGSVEFSEYGSGRYDNLDSVERALESQDSGSEVVLVSVDGHILTAPISSAERNSRNVELDTPQFHLGPGEGTEDYDTSDDTWNADYLGDLDKSANRVTNDSEDKFSGLKKDDLFSSCMELRELAVRCTNDDQKNTEDPHVGSPENLLTNDKVEENNLEIWRNDDATPYDSGFPTSISSPESQPKSNDNVNTGSPMEIIDGITKDANEKSPLSTVTNDDEKRNLEVSRNDAHDSGSPASMILPELQSKNDNTENTGYTVEIVGGITEAIRKKSPLSTSSSDRIGLTNLEMSRNDDELSTHDSGSLTSMTLLELQPKSDATDITGSTAEIVGIVTEVIHDNYPLITLNNDKFVEQGLEMSKHDDEILSSHDSGSPRGVTSPELKVDEESSVTSRNDNALSPLDSGSPRSVTLQESRVESEIHGGSTFDTGKDGSDSVNVQFACDDLELQKQIEVGSAVKASDSDAEGSVTEDRSSKSEHGDLQAFNEDLKSDLHKSVEISLCGNLLHPGMGVAAAEDAFETNRISADDFKLSAASIIKNENLVVRLQGKQYLPWDKAAHTILGLAAFGLDLPIVPEDAIPVEHEEPEEAKEDDSEMTSTPSRRWRLWPIPFRRVKTLEHSGGSNTSNEEVLADTESVSSITQPTPSECVDSPRKQIIRTNVPTTDQIVALNLKEGQNMVNFVFSTRVLGSQKVEAHIYLWKWNTRIVISDVDGTITKSDVLGQFMPLVGKDWTHSGIARLFSAIKENGYQLLFLSARAIVQAYLTKSFLFNLKQDGKSLPNGPVVISPDGLFPSLYREVIRRAPHEFKIACLEDIKALFPPDYNPFYAGFGNRDTDELSYRKIGIPKGKIFIINPKGEVAINHRIDVKSYTSLHTLVHDMFPPTALVEQEDYNSWNYWKTPLPDIDDL